MGTRLDGSEKFILHNKKYEITVSDYWSWAYSDLVSNTSRGVIAEFIVMTSMGMLSERSIVRNDWEPYDLTSPSGRRIEVKSSAYIQSWTDGSYSKIIFDIAPKRVWTLRDGYSKESARHSDVYVFCVFSAMSKDKSVLDLDFWDFYVLPTHILNAKVPKQKSIGLNSLLKLGSQKVDYSELGAAIETVKV